MGAPCGLAHATDQLFVALGSDSDRIGQVDSMSNEREMMPWGSEAESLRRLVDLATVVSRMATADTHNALRCLERDGVDRWWGAL